MHYSRKGKISLQGRACGGATLLTTNTKSVPAAPRTNRYSDKPVLQAAMPVHFHSLTR